MQGDALMSKKYILAKDLPFAKRGTEVNVSGDRIFVQRGKSKLEACIDALELWDSTSENIQKELQRLIDEGWIEEVKPREWYEVERLMPNGIWAYESNRYDTEEDAISDYSGDKTKLRVIKVREVLE